MKILDREGSDAARKNNLQDPAAMGTLCIPVRTGPDIDTLTKPITKATCLLLYHARIVCYVAFASAGPITLSIRVSIRVSWSSSYRYGDNTHENILKKSNIPGSACEPISKG